MKNYLVIKPVSLKNVGLYRYMPTGYEQELWKFRDSFGKFCYESHNGRRFRTKLEALEDGMQIPLFV